jgi:hypothetical protein
MVLALVGNHDAPATAFADSSAQIADARKADDLVRLLFLHADNLFLRPS